MARQIIDIGIQGNDGTGDSIRESFRKVNDNFQQLFAIFGSGETIAFTDLDDTPNSYGANQVVVSSAEADALLTKDLVGGDGILVDHSDPNQITIISTGGRLINDDAPTLSNHLNANGFGIGQIREPSEDLVSLYNSLYGSNATEDDFAITRGYADRRYLQSGGGSNTGSQIRLRLEPSTVDAYFNKIDDWVDGYALVGSAPLTPGGEPPGHGFNTGVNGSPFVYRNDGATPATGLFSDTTYHIRYIDNVRLGIYASEQDAKSDVNRIIVNLDPIVSAVDRGNETLIDAFYDPTLKGNWLSNEALPRMSVVRRQGDKMDGVLVLQDHPGEFGGLNIAQNDEDLQAATKFYVDSSSYSSIVNLYVSTSGDDNQTNIPLEKQGRALSYAFSSIGAACARAEEIINESATEPGPYRQRLTYSSGAFEASLSSVDTNVDNRRTLHVFTNSQGVDQTRNPDNRDLREGSVIKGIRSGATGLVVSYNGVSGTDAIYEVDLLHKITDFTVFEANYILASAKLLGNKSFIQSETVAFINTKYPSLAYDSSICSRDIGLIVDALALDIKYGGNRNTLNAAKAYYKGAVSALPAGQLTETVDAINYAYLLMEQIVANTLIASYNPPPGGVDTPNDVRKRGSVAQDVSGLPGELDSLGLIRNLLDVVIEILENGLESSTFLEFIPGEPLEYGQPVPEVQITVFVESGIYYEQLPIRVPPNVSIKGDEFRRSIIRPAPGESLSPWVRQYFYREDEFDGLTRTYLSDYGVTAAFNSGTSEWEITVGSTVGLEEGMYLKVLEGPGSFDELTQVKEIINSTTFTITIPPVSTGFNGSTAIRGLNTNNLAPKGENLAYHYLIDPSNPNSRPKQNKDLDMFLLNDGTILRNITAQGHGGFMCVLDPTGQIQTKSPYFQIATSLSGSINRQRFAGGMLIDGFAGNLKANITSVDSPTQIQLGGLFIRKPQVPCSFYINGERYQINIITNYNKSAGTAIAVLDGNTPYYPFNQATCSRDVGLILDAIGYDLVLGSNYQSVKSGLSYLRSYASTVPNSQKYTTINGINKARDLLIEQFEGNNSAITELTNKFKIVTDILNIGADVAPAITYPASLNSSSDSVKAKDIIVANKDFIKSEINAWIAAQVAGNISPFSTSYTYDQSKCARDVGYIVDALCYDLMYGGNSQIKDVSESFYRNGTSYVPGQETQHVAAFNRLKTILGYIVVNNNSWSKSAGNTLTQNVSLPSATSTEVTRLNTLSNILIDYVADGTYSTSTPTVLPTTTGEPLLSLQTTIQTNKTSIQSAVIEFLNIIEIDTPGNRSMLANDFTQVNDLGYGCIALNNGIAELVSVFSYYCWTSYYSVNGGQIRSVAGNSSYGQYGLRAKGRDPNEVPDQVVLGDAVLQQAKIYKRGSLSTKSASGDSSFYIDNYWYIPFNTSEVEIDHTSQKSNLVDGSESIVNGGSGYSVDDLITAVGGTVEIGKSATTFRVSSVNGLGAITGIELVDPGTYIPASAGTFTDSPAGVYPVVTGTFNVTGGSGFGAQLSASFLGIRALYEITTLEKTTIVGDGVDELGNPTTKQVIKLNLDTAGAAQGSQPTLYADLYDGQIISIRALQKLRFEDVQEIRPVRPSTALEFQSPATGNQILRTLAYELSNSVGDALPPNQVLLSFDSNFEYVLLDVDIVNIAAGYGLNAGDTKLAILPVGGDKLTRVNSGELIFFANGRGHRILSYHPAGTDGPSTPAYVSFVDLPYGQGSIVTGGTGLVEGFTNVRNTTIRAGINGGSTAFITVRISTCRATAHDFLDVGSGGYNDTNYPNNLYGAPANDPNKEQEVVEETQGRVFYVSTDQNGVFKVGRFFEVDQGTGNVTFNAPITLTDLNGIGFKKGTFVTEFSTDETMQDNDSNTVPVESAVRGYVDRRLGISHEGNIVPETERIGPGFLSLDGTLGMGGDLNMAGPNTAPVPHKIINLAPPNDASDAATKGYVDAEVAKYDTLKELKDVTLVNRQAGDFLIFNPNTTQLTNARITGDVNVTVDFARPYSATLQGGITTFPTVDVGIIGTSSVNVSGGIVVNEDITSWPSTGYIQIDNEIFKYTSKTNASKRLEGITRGEFATTVGTHSAGASVVYLSNTELEIMLGSQVISNTNISDSAAIAQSKLDLKIATTSASAPTGTAAQIQAASGVASFDSANFDVSNGWVGIKAGGVSLAEIQNITAGSIIGNLTGASAAPQEVTTSGIVGNGITSLFATVDDNSSSVLSRRVNSLNSTAFSNRVGNAIPGSGTFSNVPGYTIPATGTGFGARFNVSYSGGGYTNVVAVYGGSNYQVGTQIKIDGSLLGGTSGVQDLTIVVASENLDGNTYYSFQRTSTTAEASSIVRTDANRNLGTSGDKFNNIYATTFTGTATKANNLVGSTVGSIPYQSATDTTTLLSPGAAGTFLKSNGTGAAPSWTAIPDGSAGSLTGDTLAANVVNSSLTSVGILTTLSLAGLLNYSVDSAVVATGTTQGGAQALTKNVNNVASGTGGVLLPNTTTLGHRIIVRNETFNDVKVYPNSNGKINDLAVNAAFTLPAGAVLEFIYLGVTPGSSPNGQWATPNATLL